MKYAYNKGCALTSTAKAYDISMKAACSSLDIELVEIDTNCCGTPLTLSTSPYASTFLCAQNIIEAEKHEIPMVLPCSGCYKQHHLALEQLKTEKVKKAAEAINFVLPTENNELPTETNKLFSSIDIFLRDSIPHKIADLADNKLKGLKVACYYGCQLTRPRFLCTFDKPEQPVSMDQILQQTGAETVDFSCKTQCCGAALSLPRPDVVEDLTNSIIENALAYGANVIATCCPTCQQNLEQRQTKTNMPVVFFTELLAMAINPESTVTFERFHLKPSIKTIMKICGSNEEISTSAELSTPNVSEKILLHTSTDSIIKQLDLLKDIKNATVLFAIESDSLKETTPDDSNETTSDDSFTQLIIEAVKTRDLKFTVLVDMEFNTDAFYKEDLFSRENFLLLKGTIGKIIKSPDLTKVYAVDFATGRPLEIDTNILILNSTKESLNR